MIRRLIAVVASIVVACVVITVLRRLQRDDESSGIEYDELRAAVASSNLPPNARAELLHDIELEQQRRT